LPIQQVGEEIDGEGKGDWFGEMPRNAWTNTKSKLTMMMGTGSSRSG
jgi:hypothetical protein